MLVLLVLLRSVFLTAHRLWIFPLDVINLSPQFQFTDEVIRLLCMLLFRGTHRGIYRINFRLAWFPIRY